MGTGRRSRILTEEDGHPIVERYLRLLVIVSITYMYTFGGIAQDSNRLAKSLKDPFFDVLP